MSFITCLVWGKRSWYVNFISCFVVCRVNHRLQVLFCILQSEHWIATSTVLCLGNWQSSANYWAGTDVNPYQNLCVHHNCPQMKMAMAGQSSIVNRKLVFECDALCLSLIIVFDYFSWRSWWVKHRNKIGYINKMHTEQKIVILPRLGRRETPGQPAPCKA